jgi:hypothetical protein
MTGPETLTETPVEVTGTAGTDDAAPTDAVEADVAPPAPSTDDAPVVADSAATWNPSQWHGRKLVDEAGNHLGKLQDVYVDVETDQPMFATVKEGLWPGRHLTFVPLLGVRVEPEELHVPTTAERVSSAPDLDLHGAELSQDDESELYHHFRQNYFPPETASGRRLARR